MRPRIAAFSPPRGVQRGTGGCEVITERTLEQASWASKDQLTAPHAGSLGGAPGR